MNNYLTIDKKILQIAKCEYAYFLNKSNVIGVALGYKIKNGFYTCEKVIKVFVTKKICANKLLKKDLIPTCYKGIKTDVVESSVQKAYSFNKKIRPVPGGYNIGPDRNSASGTLGCLVKDRCDVYLLSNNHVLTDENEIPIGAPIVQPCSVLGGRGLKDTIGTLSKYIDLKYMKKNNCPENLVDCAMAKVSDKSLTTNKIALLGRIKGVCCPKLGEKVQKVGASSELTKGEITALGATIIVDLFRGSCLFKDQIVTTSMAIPGDSGSILFDTKMNALGLLISGNDSESTSNSIINVLKSLNVKIVA